MSAVSSTRRARLLGSAFYLAFFAAGGATYPYFNLFYQSAGMTSSQIGVLAALPTLMTLFAAPMWTGLADRLRLNRVLLPLTLLGTALPALLLTGATGFGELAVLTLWYMFFLAPIIPLADSAILTMLDQERQLYGWLRVWGAVGFGLSSFITGQIAVRHGLSSIFIIFAVLITMAALVASRLPIPRRGEPQAYLAGLRRIIGDYRWRVLLTAIFLAGTGFAMYDNFYGLYARSLGADESQLGVIFLLSTLSELPIFLLTPWLLRRYSVRGVILMSVTASFVRALGYSLAIAPWQVGLFQLLHGLSFSALWTAATIYVSQIAPEGLAASSQAVLSMFAQYGLGRVAGVLLAGHLYDAVGAVTVFRVAAAIILTGLIVFARFGFRERASRPVPAGEGAPQADLP